MKIRRFAAALAILAILLAGFALPVHAADLTQKGTLTIVTEFNKNALAGMNIEIFLVADAVLDGDGEIKYIPTEEFADALKDIEPDPYMAAGDNAALALAIRAYISSRDIDGILSVTDEDGAAYFTNLAAGMYLITHNADDGSGNNGIYNIQSFLVTVPYPVGDGFLNYIVIANPKIEEIPPTTEPTTPPTTEPPPPTTWPTESPPTTQPTTQPPTVTTEPPTTTTPTTGPTEPTIYTTEPTTAPEIPTEPTIEPTEPPLEEEASGTAPLGNITFPEEEEFEEDDNTVPLGNLPTEPQPKENPKTGGSIMFILAMLVICAGASVIIVRKNKQEQI